VDQRAEARRRYQQLRSQSETRVHEVAVTATDRKTQLKEIAKHVLERVSDAKDHKIPMLPRVAARALQLANDPEVSIKELESVIQPDPMLMARMLSIANSPVYATGKQITTLRTAMMMLGVGLVRDILYQSVAEAHIFRGANETYLRRQRLHGIAVAYIARDLCVHVGMGKDHAFLAGIMHDIGSVVLRQALEIEHPEGLELEEIGEVIELIHPHVGRVVCERWGMPGLVREAARRHHLFRNYDRCGGYSQIGHTVAAAERLAQHVGLGDTPTASDLDDHGMMLLFELGLDHDAVDQMIEGATDLRAQLAG